MQTELATRTHSSAHLVQEIGVERRGNAKPSNIIKAFNFILNKLDNNPIHHFLANHWRLEVDGGGIIRLSRKIAAVRIQREGELDLRYGSGNSDNTKVVLKNWLSILFFPLYLPIAFLWRYIQFRRNTEDQEKERLLKKLIFRTKMAFFSVLAFFLTFALIALVLYLVFVIGKFDFEQEAGPYRTIFSLKNMYVSEFVMAAALFALVALALAAIQAFYDPSRLLMFYSWLVHPRIFSLYTALCHVRTCCWCCWCSCLCKRRAVMLPSTSSLSDDFALEESLTKDDLDQAQQLLLLYFQRSARLTTPWLLTLYRQLMESKAVAHDMLRGVKPKESQRKLFERLYGMFSSSSTGGSGANGTGSGGGSGEDDAHRYSFSVNVDMPTTYAADLYNIGGEVRLADERDSVIGIHTSRESDASEMMSEPTTTMGVPVTTDIPAPVTQPEGSLPPPPPPPSSSSSSSSSPSSSSAAATPAAPAPPHGILPQLAATSTKKRKPHLHKRMGSVPATPALARGEQAVVLTEIDLRNIVVAAREEVKQTKTMRKTPATHLPGLMDGRRESHSFNPEEKKREAGGTASTEELSDLFNAAHLFGAPVYGLFARFCRLVPGHVLADHIWERNNAVVTEVPIQIQSVFGILGLLAMTFNPIYFHFANKDDPWNSLGLSLLLACLNFVLSAMLFRWLFAQAWHMRQLASILDDLSALTDLHVSISRGLPYLPLSIPASRQLWLDLRSFMILSWRSVNGNASPLVMGCAVLATLVSLVSMFFGVLAGKTFKVMPSWVMVYAAMLIISTTILCQIYYAFKANLELMEEHPRMLRAALLRARHTEDKYDLRQTARVLSMDDSVAVRVLKMRVNRTFLSAVVTIVISNVGLVVMRTVI